MFDSTSSSEKSRSQRSKERKRKEKRGMNSVPSYLRGTVSSRGKGSAANRYQNDGQEEKVKKRKRMHTYSKIFFDRDGQDKPLTESELRDSNINLIKQNISQ